MNLPEHVAVLTRGEADEPERELFDPATRALVRYADPAAWITATAVARALDPLRDMVAADHDRVGLVVTSAWGAMETMATVGETARSGFASPLRYPAGNPWSLAGVACILFGLRGSTLALTMPPAEGIPVALLLAARWLHHQGAPLVVVGACSLLAPDRYRARCLVLARPDSPRQAPAEEQAAALAWLGTASNGPSAEVS